MTDTGSFERQLANDVAALLDILPGLERLEAAMEDARASMTPGQRGYFTPQEDDAVRQLLLTYRNYRRAVWEIIHRYKAYTTHGMRALRLRGFVVGYCAALALFRRSLRMVELVEGDRMLRSKLNEADAKFGLERGFFEDVLVSYTSIYNYFKVMRAHLYWLAQRRHIRALAAGDAQYRQFADSAVRDRRALKVSFWAIFRKRLKRDWKAALRTLFRPLKLARYGSQAALASAIASLRLAPSHVRGLTPGVLDEVHSRARFGDVLLVRAEDKVTAALLPGFWSHAAIYIGGKAELSSSGMCSDPWVARRLRVVEREDLGRGLVLEAISRGVRINPLEECLQADHAVILRPRLPAEEIRAAVREGFGHVGKAYDFEFDFNTSARLVCTGLVWRAYHGRGPIAFALIKRLGRYTLSGDDVADQVLASMESNQPAFDIAGLWLQDSMAAASLVAPDQAFTRLRKLRARESPEVQVDERLRQSPLPP